MDYHTFCTQFDLGARVQRNDIERPELRRIVSIHWKEALYGQGGVGLFYGTELQGGGAFAKYREAQLELIPDPPGATT